PTPGWGRVPDRSTITPGSNEAPDARQPEEPGQPRPAEGALPLPRPAGARGRFPFSERSGWSVDGGVQSNQDRPSFDGRVDGVFAPGDRRSGRSGACPVECRALYVDNGPADSGAGAGSR